MLQTSTKALPRRKPVRIGPEDDGRRMSLDVFADAIAQEGHLYELGKGGSKCPAFLDRRMGSKFKRHEINGLRIDYRIRT